MGKLPFEKEKKEVLVKREAATDPTLGEDFNKRAISKLLHYGAVNVDKFKGPTSHQISDFVKKILKVKKCGHSGSLDPGVTGVLPIAIGDATRVVDSLLKAGKEYVCIMHLHKEVPVKEIKKVMKKFKGKTKQRPPIKSAVKRVERYRQIYYIEILEIDGKDVLFTVGCEAGTYIRVLCHQIGQTLGVGAHMAELRRTKAGPFTEETLCTLQDLTDALWYLEHEGNEKFIRKCIQPIEHAVEHLPKIWIMDNAVEGLTHGVDLKIPGITKLQEGIEPDQMVAVMTLKDELVALGTAKMASNKIMKEEKGIVVKVHKVFMKSGLYKI